MLSIRCLARDYAQRCRKLRRTLMAPATAMPLKIPEWAGTPVATQRVAGCAGEMRN
jgi:hypothetical protein